MGLLICWFGGSKGLNFAFVKCPLVRKKCHISTRVQVHLWRQWLYSVLSGCIAWIKLWSYFAIPKPEVSHRRLAERPGRLPKAALAQLNPQRVDMLAFLAAKFVRQCVLGRYIFNNFVANILLFPLNLYPINVVYCVGSVQIQIKI